MTKNARSNCASIAGAVVMVVLVTVVFAGQNPSVPAHKHPQYLESEPVWKGALSLLAMNFFMLSGGLVGVGRMWQVAKTSAKRLSDQSGNIEAHATELVRVAIRLDRFVEVQEAHEDDFTNLRQKFLDLEGRLLGQESRILVVLGNIEVLLDRRGGDHGETGGGSPNHSRDFTGSKSSDVSGSSGSSGG